MPRFPIFLAVIAVLISIAWTFTVEDDGQWPWTQTKYIARSNWTTLLKANDKSSKIHHSVWFIFQYLTYCGFCKKAEPGWEAAAQYAASWSRYIKIGAYDCASDSQSSNDTCPDEGYPQWRIFCPLTNSTQLAFDSERRSGDTTPEEILMWSIKKINKIAPQCYGKSWPIRPAIEPQIRDDLNHLIPKNTQKFQLFVSDDVLQYSLYVLNNSKTVFKEPIYRLAKNNPLLPEVGVWKGNKTEDGQILLEKIDSTKAMEPFVLNKNIHSHTAETPKTKPALTMKPTVLDVDSAVVWMISKDLRRKLPAHFEDVKAWLSVLHQYYPGSETVKRFLGDLIEFMNNRTTITGKELQNYVNSTTTTLLPAVNFDHCNGSDPSKRGYPCTLWVLFHSMTVKQALLAEKNQLSVMVKPWDIIVSIRKFIGKFFLCEECAQHFKNMTANAENEVNSFKESVLYLWRGHNQVNRRIRHEETSTDPAWPKVPFPTKQQCSACVNQVDQNGDATDYDEHETFAFLKDYYNLHSASSKKSAGVLQESDRCFLLISLVFSMFLSLLG